MLGAGGSQGGTGRFFIGLVMIIAGGYLLLKSISVSSGFGLGMGLFHFGSFQVTSGMVLVPFIFGIGFVFYDSRKILGWALAGASLVMLVAGVIMSLRFSMRHMSAFDILTIFVLLFGGIGLFLSSLRDASK